MAKKKDLSPLAFTRAGKYKSHTPTQEQKDIIRGLYNRVNQRLKNVAKHPELPQTAREKFDDKVRGRLRNLDDMSKGEAVKLYDDLHYIDSLKSSSVKGGKAINAIGRELMGESYSSLTKGKQSALWTLVKKMQDYNKSAGKGSQGSPEVVRDVKVASETGNIGFRQLRDKKTGRFTSNYEAYFIDSSGNEISLDEHYSDLPIDLEERGEDWVKFHKTRNARLLRGY